MLSKFKNGGENSKLFGDENVRALAEHVRHSLMNQLLCHAVFASGKPTWDLETWRPDVGYAATVTALTLARRLARHIGSLPRFSPPEKRRPSRVAAKGPLRAMQRLAARAS